MPVGRGKGDLGSATEFFPITPADGVDLAVDVRAIIVNGAGNVAVTRSDGVNVVIPLPVGMFPLSIRRVKATGTTATGLVGVV